MKLPMRTTCILLFALLCMPLFAAEEPGLPSRASSPASVRNAAALNVAIVLSFMLERESESRREVRGR